MVTTRGQVAQGAVFWLGLPLLITMTGFLPGDVFGHSALLLLYLCAVLFTALKTGLQSVLLCALLSFLLFNFFFTEPRYSLFITEKDELISTLLFIVFAVLAGWIAARLNSQLWQLRYQRDFFESQVEFYSDLQEISSEEEIPGLLQAHFGEFFGDRVNFRLTRNDGKSSSTFDLDFVNDGVVRESGLGAMLLSLREQVQSVVDRLATEKALKAAERQGDEEKLRSALLSSVSHDLKTPLVTMLGAATTLRDLREDISSEDATELLGSIIAESQRLESYIQNLLDMTRLGQNGLSLSRDWVHIEEIYHVARRRLSAQGTTPTLKIGLRDDIPLLHVHAALIEQGLFNVLENAVKASGKQGEILINVYADDGFLHIEVSDQGPGLPREEWSSVFDPFHTFSLGDCYEKGTGLGLSICRSIFAVHGGNARIVEAKSGFNHCVEMTLPLARSPEKFTDMEHESQDTDN